MTSDYKTILKDLEICTNINANCAGCSRSDPDGFPNCQGNIRIRARDSIKELVNRLPKWIPVTERLPEQGKRYLVIRFDEVTKTQFIDILWHDAHDLWWNRLYIGQYNVTHWMPLPQPPKEEA